MCLVIFAYRKHPRYPLLLAANRDEFHARPTAPARFWEEQPGLLAGRDLEAGGTWMGTMLACGMSRLMNGACTSNACSPSWACVPSTMDPEPASTTAALNASSMARSLKA